MGRLKATGVICRLGVGAKLLALAGFKRACANYMVGTKTGWGLGCACALIDGGRGGYTEVVAASNSYP